MNENNGNHVTEGNKEGDNYKDMASLLAEEGLGLDLPKTGEIKTGRIASISPGQVMVGIGAKSEGIIRGQEFELIPPDVLASLSVGQDIPVFIITPEDHHGNLLLSYVRAMEAETWEKAQQLMDDKESFTGKVDGYNRGGLLVTFNGLNGFIPGSQLSFTRRTDVNGTTPEERFNELIGEEIELRVIEVDQERRRLIFSERAAVHESRDSIRDKVIEKVDVGEVRTGRVTSLADFGAFVNINGADGLVHLSEISWDRIRHPSDVLQVGQEVEVEVISIDEVKRHIGLSIRRLQNDPWQDQIGELKVGQLVNATITRLTKFGAFAQITEDIEGLIHISEISDEHIAHPKEVLHEGEQVTLRIIKIESDSHRIGLSLRRVESLAFADMDLKELEKELEGSDITITSDDAPAESNEPEKPAESDQDQTPPEQTLAEESESVEEVESEQEKTESVEEVESEQEETESVEEVESEQEDTDDSETTTETED